ncbi:MAG: FKBP-type peptidyl-prolyl cis-trans isomerase [Azospira sp.]|jgi:FKBP-type peptidyl-prolyl cis-trans isomerase SlpA|nr:FKBP-type peptidyl-prolyl cis-trans isomerase [Azospira sp.]
MDQPVTVQPDSFLTLHYRLSGLDGTEHVSTFDMSPATLQMGAGQLAASLEACLLGLGVGEHHVFQLEADDAFGRHNPRLVERIARSALPPEMELKVNSLIEFSAPDGASVPGVPGGGIAGLLCELTDTTAVFDFNHPLAGRPVRFEVKIVGIL